MIEQDIERIVTGQRPTSTDSVIWNMYWERQGQPWRNQPEINADRQKYLEERRHRVFKGRKWINPLQDIQLSRADIEWLLATHEHGRGPVDWNDSEQRQRKGLFLSKTDLRNVDLSKLPLANADFSNAHLEGATLSSAHLENANLVRAHLENADLSLAHLEDAFLVDAHLQGANLAGSHLERAMLMHAHIALLCGRGE